jgi:hypothetical protein
LSMLAAPPASGGAGVPARSPPLARLGSFAAALGSSFDEIMAVLRESEG